MIASTLLACAPATFADAPPDPDVGECTEDEQGALFDRYIEPVVTDAHPSSCNECHLAGVDLSMYVQGTPCESMACMVEQGVVDLDDPVSSQVLAFVTQGEPASELITDTVRDREYQGFLEWIEWSAECHAEVCGDIDDPCGRDAAESLPEGVETPLGGCDEDSLVELFQDKVMTWEGRCASCHWSEGQGREDNPTAPVYFARTSDGSWARGTMYNLIGLGAVDPINPATSLLMTKPLEEGATVDTELGEVTGIVHGGGDKIHVEDGRAEETLYDFVDWLGAYADCF